jgi:hypothetical protein
MTLSLFFVINWRWVQSFIHFSYTLYNPYYFAKYIIFIHMPQPLHKSGEAEV